MSRFHSSGSDRLWFLFALAMTALEIEVVEVDVEVVAVLMEKSLVDHHN